MTDARDPSWSLSDERLAVLGLPTGAEKSEELRKLANATATNGTAAEMGRLLDLLIAQVPVYEFARFADALLAGMIDEDFGVARDWLVGHDGHPEFAGAFRAFGEAMAAGRPEMVAEVCLALDGRELKARRVAEGAVCALAGAGKLAEAVALRDALEVAGYAREGIDKALVEGGPGAALVELMAGGGLDPADGLKLAMGKWVGEDSAAALAWITARMDEGIAPIFVRTFAGSWAYEDTNAASEWLLALPAGDMRDHALRGAIDKAVYTHPNEGMEWAMAISDPKLRERTIATTLNVWDQVDPDAARKARESIDGE